MVGWLVLPAGCRVPTTINAEERAVRGGLAFDIALPVYGRPIRYRGWGGRIEYAARTHHVNAVPRREGPSRFWPFLATLGA